jgi:pullulanase/glycogen debranching enzyme
VVVFIFDPELYEADPDRVVVTGTFRNWDQKMDEKEWTMKKTDQLWTLSVDNFEFRILKPNDEFKFRINGGLWMEPPLQSVDKKNGNMVFMKDAIIPALHAEIRGPYTIWARVTGDRPLSEEDYVISSANGERVEISAVLPQTATETLITTSEPMDIKRVYFLEIPAQGMKSFCSFDGWFRELYSGKELGAQIHGNATTIRVFAPRAERLRVYLYRNRDDTKAYRTEDMTVDENGVWEISFDENLHGTYYDFTIHGAPDPGNHFYETNPVHITDPYARVSDNTWGKCRIWEKTTPASPLQQGIPEMKDVIAYEVHVQDFTDLLPVDEALKGSFQAMIQPGLTNSRGEKIGFDYLVDLGINTVHLMPVQEYLHFPDDDWKASFADDPYMIDQGVSEENYQWGYRTSHAFAVESKYRKKGEEPGTERAAFRDLVQAFHDHGMAVIIDIVPNHTAENMDGNEWYFNFNALDKLYYYRTKNFEHIGAYGNEIKTENRPMVQRWIIDQCRHFIDEFGIDGFRIDLAGQIDQQTLLALKEALGHDKILYGEAWIGSNDPAFESNPDWDWYKEDAPITFFQDDSRNAFKGPVFELRDKYQDRGWPGGKYDERPNVMKGLANAFDADKTPVSGISYLDIHDNFALADQFASANFDGRYAVDQDLYKIAVTLLYTTLGPIVTHGGSEIMRSKAAAPLKEVVKETNAGYKIYMHGKRDTYNHRMANRFIWENVGAKPTKTNQNDYENMLAFWKGMNAFRSSIYGAVFRVADPVPQEYYEWFLPEDKSMLGYLVDESVLVLLNAGSQTNEFTNLNLPEGTWRLIAHNRAVDHADGVRDPDLGGQLSGGLQEKISLAPESLRIWVLEAPDK